MKGEFNNDIRIEAIYGRQSIEKKDSISIETQIEFCLKEAKNPQRVRVYTDKGYSGSNIERPDFQRLLRDIKSGLISKVIIYRLDRMSRSLLDFAQLIQLFKKYNVEFQSTQEKFDTSTPIGNAMLSITMVFAQLERETIQQRITDNYYARGKQGAYLGGPAPWGFEIIKTTLPDGKHIKGLNPISEQVVLIQKIFSMYGLENKTLGDIARYLNDYKIPSPKGAIWYSSKISRTLRNPVYVKSDVGVYQYYKSKGCVICNDVEEYGTGVGLYLYGKREAHERKYTNMSDHKVSLAIHEGIVSSNLFLKVQHKLDQNMQVDNHNKGKHTWLTGLVKCKKCGYSLTVRTSYNARYKYWYCSGKQSGVCNVKIKWYLKVQEVENIIQNALFEVIQQNKDIIIARESCQSKEKNKVMAKLEKLDEQVEKLIKTLLESSIIASKYLNKKLEEIENEKQILNNQLNKLLADEDKNISQKQLFDVIKDWFTLDNLQKRSIVDMFIEKVLIGNDVEIFWKYNFLDNTISNS